MVGIRVKSGHKVMVLPNQRPVRLVHAYPLLLCQQGFLARGKRPHSYAISVTKRGRSASWPILHVSRHNPLSQFLDSNLITVPDLTQRTMKPRNWNDFLRRSSGP